jgi:peptidoglycan/xylan/chitin deacetylase (PgdA/CDA1 family)
MVTMRVPDPAVSDAVYLTFDDGPDPEVTPRVLDLLDRYDAKATFFLIGRQAERRPRVSEELVARGHQLGNHSLRHRQFESLPLQEQLEEIRRTDEVLRGFDGRAEHPFRPPHGKLSLSLMLELRRDRRPPVLWSIDSQDYTQDSAHALAALRRQRARSGDIVLMHDDHPTVLDLLGNMLPEWSTREIVHPTIGAV